MNDTSKPGRAKKTVIVEVVRRLPRPGLRQVRQEPRKKYHAHDEKEEYRQNDLVEIRESRPLSRTKRWVVIASDRAP